MGSSTNYRRIISAALGFVGLMVVSISLDALAQYETSCTENRRACQTPLSGTQQPLPAMIYYDYINGSAEFARLLDVGACSNDSSISYVPPLDGTSPAKTLRIENYGMKFVLFDLQLIDLRAFDAVGGSFTLELQMALHWLDEYNDTHLTPLNDKCGFLCDTTSAQPLCCDDIWVPPLRLPGCTINAIQSITDPDPYLHFTDENDAGVVKRFWYLNIDATCAAKADFRNFPFDIQTLTIDVVNPYASRTWFQLNKGFLKHNVGEGIAGIDLNPDRKTAGWEVKNLLVSSSCGTQESWQQTFLTQDYLLSILRDHTKPTYNSQSASIMDALNPDRKLECAEMKSVEVEQELLSNPAYLLPYKTTTNDYEKRVQITLQRYRECVETSENNYFYLNTSTPNQTIEIPDMGIHTPFDVSEVNINRSFGLLDLTKQQPTKVSFKCAIAAVANLTTPGIRITILVQRFRMFYVVKLILPAVACVTFTFSAFGLQPTDLVGRLTVVVPSAIALTALQGLVVATDIPPVAYIAPTTYILLLSYAVQLVIAFESVFMSIWLKKRWRRVNDTSNAIELTSQQDNTSMVTSNALATILQQTRPVDTKVIKHRVDRISMGVLAAVYIVAILACTITPWLGSRRLKSTLPQHYVNMWDDT